MPVFTNPGAPGAYNSTNGGKVTGFNAIGNAGPTALLAANPQRVSITFHNPGAQDILVYPTTTATGAAQTPTPATPGGGFRIFANGGTLVVQGECQQAWAAIAFAGVNQSLTVMESNVG